MPRGPIIDTITHDNCEELGVTEHDLHSFTAEASTLGWPVGSYPSSIDTDLGNSMPFLYTHTITHEGDVVSWVYRQANGIITLHVFND